MKRFSLILLAVSTLLSILVSCGSAKLSVADEQMERGEYFDAAKTYRKVYNKMTKREQRPDRGKVALKMAECYRRLSQFPRASAAYQNAIRYGAGDSTTTLALARSLHAEGKYAQAITAYEDYLSTDPENESAQLGLSGARGAIEAKADPTRYVVRQHKLVNSRRSDYAPMYAGENDDMQTYASPAAFFAITIDAFSTPVTVSGYATSSSQSFHTSTFARK